MYVLALYIFGLLLGATHSQDESPEHGEGAEGSEMGPVAFLWPADRNWSAAADNIAPCGSTDGVTNRSIFPLSQGSVALSIADEAWHVAFRIAFGNNPTTQNQFAEQVVNNITEIEPGHQCYKLNQLEGVTAGTNATIQLEYWSEYEGENNGNNQSFFACADVTFVEAKDFTIQVPCFNVTSDDFNEPTPSSNPAASTSGAPRSSIIAPTESATSSQAASSSGGGLSTGAKAGIAVGSIIGAIALISAIAFFVWRRGKATGLKNRESYELRAAKLGGTTPEAASATSGGNA
ncbi:hypothetical protein CC78DRAFT_572021 [Lojkania enalia]|uniref:Copper acquisition factor BIM1-like domain-containing protein n=1 Tax=Lojkania enalia TaxID=147567 RepID=A0A9P4MVN3_9PLEO|nr:hypothetical protein CC78DRAFT_572021 [Didymosphaeria enalia]